MATSITNQATLTYEYGVSTAQAVSNIASIVLEGPLSASKRALESVYRQNDILTYTIIIKNTGSTLLNNLIIEDDLGSYEISTGNFVTPVEYIGPSNLYVNDSFLSTIVPAISITKDTATFIIPTVAAGATVMIVYKVKANEYAPLVPQTSSIHNTITVGADNLNAQVKADYTVPADEYALVEIEKKMEPNPVIDGAALTYTFDIYNYGNMDATNIVLRDAFETANLPANLTVTVDGVPFTAFDYASGVLLIPGTTATETITVEKATITQDPVGGVVTVEPKKKTIVVVGNI